MPPDRKSSASNRAIPYFVVRALSDNYTTLPVKEPSQFTIFHSKSIKTNINFKI